MWQTGTPIHCLWLFAAHQAATAGGTTLPQYMREARLQSNTKGFVFLTDTKLFSRFGSILFIYRILFMPLTKNVFFALEKNPDWQVPPGRGRWYTCTSSPSLISPFTSSRGSNCPAEPNSLYLSIMEDGTLVSSQHWVKYHLVVLASGLSPKVDCPDRCWF